LGGKVHVTLYINCILDIWSKPNYFVILNLLASGLC
jgi:hypothetical protein